MFAETEHYIIKVVIQARLDPCIAIDITLNPPSCSVEGIFADMEANQCLPRKVLVAFSKSDPVPMTESVVLYARHCLGIDINTPPLLI